MAVTLRMSDESRQPSSGAADGAAAEPRDTDRGKSVALGAMGALVLLGIALIVRGPRTAEAPAPLAPPAAALQSAEPAAALSAVVAKNSVPAAEADAGPAFVPAWRVASLRADAAIEIVEGTYGKHSLSGALSSLGFAKSELRRVSHAFDGVHRIEHPPPKESFVIAKDRVKGTIVAFEHVASPSDIWQAKVDDASPDHRLVAKKLDLFIERRPIATALAVTADLAKAVAAAGLREEAIEAIDDALDGHLDLAAIKPGVRLRVVGSEEWVEGKFARVRLDAVEVVQKADASTRVYFYERTEGRHAGFWNAKGQQPYQGTFRSPLPLARITSRFNPKRMHPVLHVVMPHNGVDFGASTGTPVYASGAGTIASAGDGGPCGNMIQIEHPNGLTTAYCHLSRFAAGIHAGLHVEARQLVGYVGQTGRATGPHLHFAVKRGGVFIDPQGIKMDGVRVIAAADRDAFATRRGELDVALEAIALPGATTEAADDKDEKDEPAGEE
jgi:murein DD-endopeptidase MepM/ murein hydrolase activator NlpD